LITKGCSPFRFEDRDVVVEIAPVCGKRPECRQALTAGVFELCTDMLAAEFLLAALVVFGWVRTSTCSRSVVAVLIRS
jgi:hypothetical protein